MALCENDRLAYLQEMGIVSYFPRRALPGARPSLRYAGLPAPLLSAPSQAVTEEAELAEQTLRALSTAGVKSEAPAPDAPVQALQASGAVAAAPESTPLKAATPAAKEAPAPAPAEEEALKFAFAFIPVNDQLAVISELPWARSASLSPSCKSLLAGILRALELPVQEQHLNPMIFTWPLFEDVQMHHDSARHTLEGFLARRLKLQPVRYLFIFAEQAAPYLFPLDTDLAQGGFFRHPRFEVDVCVTHSLNAMDAVRELKRPVWELLKPLQGRLNGGA
ncbi:MAG: hypothetical protein H7A07_02885 [Pseudomonadales bacterium]|nr:hypothetical protein [Pseudomonadales bacterium]MCP5329881.1 hypothetical protein [Pseudomonadales bacterium]